MNLEGLLAQLAGRDPRARVEAAERLGEAADQRSTAALVRALRDPVAAARAASCEALGRVGDPRAVAPLVSTLRDTDDEVRAHAFSALLAIGEARAGALPSFDGEDPEAPSEALTQIAWPADLEAVSMLVEALADPQDEVRVGAAYTLGRLGVTAAIPRLTRLLMTDPEVEVRGAAAFALGELAEVDEARAVPPLCEAWDAGVEAPELAVLLLRSLVGRRGAGVFRVFQQGARHADPRARQLAVMGFARLGDAGASAPLLRALGDPHVGVRRNSALALGHLGDPASARALVRAAEGEVPEVRAALARALSRLPSDAVARTLAAALRDPAAGRRQGAAYLAGRLKHTGGLHEATEDPHEGVRRDATLALGNAGEVGLRPSVEARLDDPIWSVRAAAAEALRRLGESAGVGALRRHAGDPHPAVRAAVRGALSALGG